MKIKKFVSVALRLKRLDSLVVLEALQNAVGLDAPVDYEQLAVALNDAGILTRRGAKFTARVVRVCLQELVDARLVEIVDSGDGGGWRLLLLESDDPNEGNEGTREPVGGADSVSNSVSNSVSKSVGVETRPYIINNKYKNKEINKTRAWRSRAQFGNICGSGSVADVVGRVDLTDAEGEAVRRKLVGVIWEPSLRRELVDRAVAAVKLGFATVQEVLGDARRAVEKARNASKRIWQFYTLDVKRYFDSKDFYWVPTEPGAENAPVADVAPSYAFDCEDEPDVFNDANGRTFVSYRRKRL